MIFTNCCPGFTALRTFSPLASSIVLFTNLRTTRRLTSASSKAILICSTVSSIFFSVIFELPLIERTILLKVPVNFSSIYTFSKINDFIKEVHRTNFLIQNTIKSVRNRKLNSFLFANFMNIFARNGTFWQIADF